MEQSGEVKKKVPVKLAPQTKKVLKIFQNKTKQAKSSLSYVPQLIKINSRKTTLINQTFAATTPNNKYKIKTSLLGKHQIENISYTTL